MAVYACTDIHGQDALFRKMLRKIRFGRNDTLYILGDIIDRGPGSIRLLKYVMKRGNIRCLLGNHELMMYTHLTKCRKEDYWFKGNNGGKKTMELFLKEKSSVRDDVLRYLSRLSLQEAIKIGDMEFLLSHAACEPESGTVAWQNVPYETAFDCVWSSPWRMSEYYPPSFYRADGRWHITGHVPVQYIREPGFDGRSAYVSDEYRLVNIDLGCAVMNSPKDAEGGKCLCCMDLTAFAEGRREEAFYYERPGRPDKLFHRTEPPSGGI